MSWVEIIESRSVAKDARGIVRGLRKFRVWDVATGQITENPESVINDDGIGLPAHNSTHPDHKSARADDINVQTNGVVHDVIYTYTSNGSGRLPDHFFDPVAEANDTGRAFQGQSGTVNESSADMPIAKQVIKGRIVRPQPQGTGSMETVIKGWEEIKLKGEYTAATERRTAVIPQTLIRLAIGASRHASGHLHTLPDGLTYRFEGMNYERVQRDKYKVRYTWSLDQGIPRESVQTPSTINDGKGVPFDLTGAVQNPNQFAYLKYPENWTSPYAPGHFARPPYAKVVLVEDPEGEQDDFVEEIELPAPLFALVRLYTFVPLGWLLLPGATE